MSTKATTDVLQELYPPIRIGIDFGKVICAGGNNNKAKEYYIKKKKQLKEAKKTQQQATTVETQKSEEENNEDEEEDTSFFSENYLSTPETEDAITSIQQLAEQFGSQNLFIVSKAGEKTRERTMQWLWSKNFFESTSIPLENVHFCKKRNEKLGICKQFNINVFIDDNLQVIMSMMDPQALTKKILKKTERQGYFPMALLWFSPAKKDLEKQNSKYMSQLSVVMSWKEVVQLLVAKKPKSEVGLNSTFTTSTPGQKVSPEAKGKSQSAELLPYERSRLKASEVHTIYYEQYGNPSGTPILTLQGTSSALQQLLNPKYFRIIAFDARGTGSSTPLGNIEQNSIPLIVQDMEQLRVHLKVEKWMVCGGSLGSALALSYAEAYPANVTACILFSVFLLTKGEIDWHYKEEGGTAQAFPEEYKEFKNFIPASEQYDLLSAYYGRLKDNSEETQLQFAKAWLRWEQQTSRVQASNTSVSNTCEAQTKYHENSYNQQTIARALVECHHLAGTAAVNDQELIANINKVQHLPCTIIHGRQDMVTDVATAQKLHKAWNGSKLVLVNEAAHSIQDEPLAKAIREETNTMSKILTKSKK